MHIRKSRFSLNNEKSYVILVYDVKSLIYRPLFFSKEEKSEKNRMSKTGYHGIVKLNGQGLPTKKMVPR